MTTDQIIAETVDSALPDDRALRIQRDTAQIEALALSGFAGPAYAVFENDLSKATFPILQGMLRNGALVRIAQKRFEDRGITFFVPPADLSLLHSSGDARDEIAVDVLMRALKSFRKKALVKGEWSPGYRGPNGPSCLTTFFVGQCAWEVRRVYLAWANKRDKVARWEAALLDPEAFFRLLRAPEHLSEPEAVLFSNAFMELLDGQPRETQAVVALTVQGYQDTEIATLLKSSPGAVRTRRYRFRGSLYQAARERKIWIPEHLHTAGVARRSQADAA